MYIQKRDSIISFALILISSLMAHSSNNACTEFFQAPTTKYALWLETHSPEREAWIRNKSGATIKALRESKNYQTVSDAVLSQNSKPTILSSDSNKMAQYELRFMGVTKPQSLVRIIGGKRTEILTTETLTRDTSFSLLQVHTSPKDTHVILVASDNGNIDAFQLYVFDLSLKKVVQQIEIAGEQITWKNENEFFFINSAQRRARSTEQLQSYNIKTGKISTEKNQNISFVDKTTFVVTEHGHSHLVGANLKKLFLPKTYFNSEIYIDSVLVRNQSSQTEIMIFAKDDSKNTGQILKSVEINGHRQWHLLYETAKNSVIESVQFNEDHIAVNVFWGPSVITKILDYKGRELFEVATPECCAMSQVSFTKDLDVATVLLSSHFKQRVSARYSIKEKRFLDPTIQKQMMSYNGIDFTSSIHWAKSEDGTRIPVRLTYRKDLPKNGQNGLLIYGYGGFNSAGYMRSFNSKMDAFFIKNGGIIAGPALRGGNEYGSKWHESATHENKFKTFQDFAATAEMVHQMGLSSRPKTAIQGWSNGGFVVAATGLLYPHLIGIVIDGNGVNDLLRKEKLDAAFGDGWSYEYGDSRIKSEMAYLKKWSPVFQAQIHTHTPQMLIVNGRRDSRVNPAHSAKLALAMQSFSSTPENISLISLNNSGHWMTSVAYQNIIAWKSQTLIWTYLFDKMGMVAKF